jgi:hypothetical protein
VFTHTLPEDLAAAMSASDALFAGDFAAEAFFAGAELVAEDAGAGLAAGAGAAAGAAIAFESAGFALAAGAGVEAGAAMLESAFLLFLDFLVEVASVAGAAAVSVAAASAFLDFFDFFVVVDEVWSVVELVWACAQPMLTHSASTRHRDAPHFTAAWFFTGIFPQFSSQAGISIA